MSPLPPVFAISIETLAIAIRSHPDIRGVTYGSEEHKCALFADKMLLFLTSPLISTPTVLQLLKDFGTISRLTVNISKSVALNVSVPPRILDQLKQHFPFPWAPDSIPYLDIKLTNNLANLYSANYPHMYWKLEEDFKTWVLCGLSWLGRLLIKMTLLPHLLYLFRSLPIPIPKLSLDLLWRPSKQRPTILASSLSNSLALCDKLHKQTSKTDFYHEIPFPFIS